MYFKILQNDLPTSFLSIGLRQRSSSTQQFEKEIRKFALSLNFYSPKVYKYVWNLWKKLLPAPRTIRSWYTQINGDPGFCEEALSALKAKTADKSKKRLFVTSSWIKWIFALNSLFATISIMDIC